MKRILTFSILASLTIICRSQSVQRWEDWQSNLNVTNYNALTSGTERNVGINFWGDRGFGQELHFRNGIWGTALYTRHNNDAIWLGNYGSNETQQQNFNPWMTLVNGKVGIATTNPSNTLTVGDGTADTRILSNPNSPYAFRARNGVNGDFYFGATAAGSPDGVFSNNAGTELMRITNGGNVGIGTTSPGYKLDVVGNLRVSGSGANVIESSAGNIQLAGQNMYLDFDGAFNARDRNGPYASRLYIQDGSGNVGIGTTSPTFKLQVEGDARINNGELLLTSDYQDGTAGISLDWMGGLDISTDVGSSMNFGSSQITAYANTFATTGDIHSSGKILIGNVDPSKVGSHSLAVNGSAIFNKVMVKSYSAWPDFVFHKYYRLRSLKALETFIQQKQHLPDVPSAEDVKTKGLDIAEVQALMLRKIEELSLYMIQEDKKIEQQSEQIRRQAEQMKALRKIHSHRK